MQCGEEESPGRIKNGGMYYIHCACYVRYVRSGPFFLPEVFLTQNGLLKWGLIICHPGWKYEERFSINMKTKSSLHSRLGRYPILLECHIAFNPFRTEIPPCRGQTTQITSSFPPRNGIAVLIGLTKIFVFVHLYIGSSDAVVHQVCAFIFSPRLFLFFL